MRVHPLRGRAVLFCAVATSLVAGGCQSATCADGRGLVGGSCLVVGAHVVCEGDPPECQCAPGYERTGTNCTWSGVVADPDFLDESSVSPWTATEDGVRLDPQASGSEGLFGEGVAALPRGFACNGDTLEQKLMMPDYEHAEPLVATITYRAETGQGVAVGFGDSWRYLPRTVGGEWRNERICLGEAAFGGEVSLRVGLGDLDNLCYPERLSGEDIELDVLDIRPATLDECPEPGSALNGALDPGLRGWLFSPEDEDANASFLADGYGVELQRSETGTTRVWAATKLSVPLVKAGQGAPALVLRWEGTLRHLLHAEIGTFVPGRSDGTLEDLIGLGADQVTRYCLPPHTYGSVVDLGFELLTAGPPGRQRFLIDEVSLVADPDCSTETTVPRFESAPTNVTGTSHFGVFQSSAAVSDPDLARSGDGVLEFSHEDLAAFWSFQIRLLVPSTPSPALDFWSNVPPAALPAKWTLGQGRSESVLPTGMGWTKNRVCLPPSWSGRWLSMRIVVGDPVATSEGIGERRDYYYFDDFELLDTEACPEELGPPPTSPPPPPEGTPEAAVCDCREGEICLESLCVAL